MTEQWGAPPADPWGVTPVAIPAHQTAPPSADDFFAGGAGAKGFSFDGNPPLRLGGVITELPPLKQKVDFDSGEPMFWKDRRPRWIMPVLCQTDERVDDDDDGVRAHYLEYKKLKAVQEAVKKAGRPMLEVGGTLFLTYLAPKVKKGESKNYGAEYYPPGVSAPAGPAAAVTPAVGPPQDTPGSVALAAGAPLELAKALVHAGMTLDQARRLPGLAGGWQNATASQILPYLVPPASDTPPF